MPRRALTGEEKQQKDSDKVSDLAQAKIAGKELVKWRSGLSQDEIVSRVSRMGFPISQDTLSKLETGKVQRPSMRDLVALGRVYGQTPNQMASLYNYWTQEDEDTIGLRQLGSIREMFERLPRQVQESFRKEVTR